MELIHYSLPYKLIANKAVEQIQRVSEIAGISIEVAESESNGEKPEEYFVRSFGEVISFLAEKYSGETQLEEEVQAVLRDVMRYITEALSEARSLIEEIYSQFISLLDEVELDNDETYAKKLNFYAGITYDTFYYRASCIDVINSLEDYINQNIGNNNNKAKIIMEIIKEKLI